ncbi:MULTISPECIES: CPBP family intramembrane glutamic endopeptidase [Ralstonia solanacearum species complex]|uniref:Putative transmembrane protein n=1 Tax=Ralstonia solanacearum TaxID=305 RepID=A0A0S4W458_RALSL|nr:type II CAAX endopeptidase family protein [Ralstonia pseudosolanacearum]CUV23069.1 putative transmembrane protein [Ralstonia solanacearum]CUV33878.1 putative transmembrane protein [Ralstonia solanacearum]CUV41612.1 putative transmembrane protein [Ralstonia solanacearum]CUV59095.1 putative transmembrane protein [Ralstonia solanacearum]
MPSSEHRYHFPNLLEAFFILIVLFFTEYLMNALIWKLGRNAGLQPMGIYSIGRVLAHGLVFTVLLHHAKGTYRALVHENPSSWQATLAVFAGPVLLLTPGLLLLGSVVQMAVSYVFPLQQSMGDTMQKIVASGLGSIVLVCLIAPVVEEMLFRGIILRSFLRQYAPGVAIVHSAAVFGLAHLNVYQFVGGFLIGLLLGKLYERTRSLLPGMLVHGCYNTAVTILAWRSERSEWTTVADWSPQWCVLAVASGGAGAWLLYKLVAPRPADRAEPQA